MFRLAAPLCFILFAPLIRGDVKSTSGEIDFYPNQQQAPSAKLNSTGLGLGVSPAANLHVQGHSIVTDRLSAGSSSSPSSNLQIHGSMALVPQTVSDNATLGASSLVFANSENQALSLTLPAAATVDGQKMTIKRTSRNNDVFIHGGGSQIEGYDSIELGHYDEANLSSVSLISASANWHLHGEIEPWVGADNLEVWYKFDETSGTSVVGYSRQNVHGTLGGSIAYPASRVDGVNDGALHLEASNLDRVSLGDLSFVEQSSVSFLLWVKLDSVSTTNDFDLLVKGSHKTDSLNKLLIFYDYDVASADVGAGNDRTLSVIYNFNGGSGDSPNYHWVAASDEALNTTEWTHVAVVLEVSTKTLSIYINGELDTSDSENVASNFGIRDSDAPLVIGKPDDRNDKNWDGSVDEFRIYSKALSAEEVASIYRLGL